MQVFDCFVFHDELDLLEIRLSEMSSSVDFFVIAEGALTFTGDPKPSYLKQNWARFEQWHAKIIHVVVKDFPQTRKRWTLEMFQRNQLELGLGKALSDDIVIVSDVDEILSAETLSQLRLVPPEKGEVLCFELRWFQFFLDNELPMKWLRVGPRAALKSTMRSPQGLRNVRGPALHSALADLIRGIRASFAFRRIIKRRLVPNSGWHFSWIGGVEAVKRKAVSITPHGNIADTLGSSLGAEKQLKSIIKRLSEPVGSNLITPANNALGSKIAPIDSSYPKIIVENLPRFSHLTLAHNPLQQGE